MIFSSRKLSDRDKSKQSKLRVDFQMPDMSTYFSHWIKPRKSKQKSTTINSLYKLIIKRLKSTIRTSVKLIILCLDVLNILVYVAESY